MKGRITLHSLLTGKPGQFLPSVMAKEVATTCQEAETGKAESIPGCQDQLGDVAVLPTHSSCLGKPCRLLCLQRIKEPEDTARGRLVW